ncbi:hypothetical protein LZ30DRAFT_79575 [Colletotrichum cereale]|nr:hypothetical protein LZ30DRAFT_79575 [Colletotrichum cereale]
MPLTPRVIPPWFPRRQWLPEAFWKPSFPSLVPSSLGQVCAPDPAPHLSEMVGRRPFFGRCSTPPAQMLSCPVPRNGRPRLFQRPGHLMMTPAKHPVFVFACQRRAYWQVARPVCGGLLLFHQQRRQPGSVHDDRRGPSLTLEGDRVKWKLARRANQPLD